jgi:surface polysaccharide O-acyltransferase-like enzyme
MNSNDMKESQMLSNNNHLKKDDNNNYQTIKRNYGVDLLRIISMINIINLHINLFSRQLSLNYTSPKFYSIWRLEVFSFCAVDCFGLISGIVGYKRYKFSNLIYIWIQLCFYSTSISLFLFIKNQINIKDLFLSLFPILIKRHWYINAYFSMYLLLPFINHGINSIK